MLNLKLRALPDKNYDLMSGWYYGLDSYPENNKFSLESFSRHIRSGRLDVATRTQFIGLFDDNKTEVFEGDIIRSYDSEGFAIIHLIEYHQESAMFVARYNNDENGFCRVTQVWINEFKKVIVGNRFENPELLTKF